MSGRFISLRDLHEKTGLMLARHPEWAALDVYGYGDGSINLDGRDDISSLSISEIEEKREAHARRPS